MTLTARTKRVAIAAVAALALAAIVVAGWWFVRGLFDPQYNVTLALVLADEPNAVETTAQLCGQALQCVEAYDTHEATYLRFDDRDQAAAFERTVADGFRSNYIVMDFAGKDDVSTEQQLWAMQSLAGFWNDYEGGFPTR